MGNEDTDLALNDVKILSLLPPYTSLSPFSYVHNQIPRNSTLTLYTQSTQSHLYLHNKKLPYKKFHKEYKTFPICHF